jgi:hypothetical protein
VPEDPPDDLDGCGLDFADPEVVSTDEDVDALLMFADLDWTGEVENGRPVVDPVQLERRIHDLHVLAGEDV